MEMENGFQGKGDILNQKLDALIILISLRFNVNLLEEFFPKSTAKQIPTRADILPKTPNLQEANGSNKVNQEFLTEGSFIGREGGAKLLLQISNVPKTKKQAKLKNNQDESQEGDRVPTIGELAEHSHLFVCNQDVQIGMAIAGIVATTSLEEKFIKGKPRVYAIKQEVKHASKVLLEYVNVEEDD